MIIKGENRQVRSDSNRGCSYPRGEFNKGKPIIQKIEFTEAEKQDIKTILEGKPTEQQIAKGERWLKFYYRPESIAHRRKTVIQKYFKGECHICGDFAEYKLTYTLDGCTLFEFYCQQHYNERITN
jgi:hypothetical protein